VNLGALGKLKELTMKVSVRKLASVVAFGILLCCTPAIAQQPRNSQKAIRVILRVEGQGPGGLWMQAGEDLSSAELTQLRSLISTEIEALQNHKLVSPDDKSDDLGLLVVAEKLQVGRASFVVLSTALTLAKADGNDLFVTHGVIAASNLMAAAKAVAGHLVSAEFRGALGLR